jgi:hypothetical protein
MVSKIQLIAINKCISVLNGWLNSNDINSTSHYNIIDEFMFDLEDDTLDGTNPDLIGESLKDLLNIIKNM